MSEADTRADEFFIEMVEAGRYEVALGVRANASRADATSAFIRLSARHSGHDRVLIALNKARSAMLSETNEERSARLSWISGLDELKQHERDLRAYEHTLVLDPENITPWFNKGVTLHQLRRDGEALAVFDHALTINPGSRITWFQKVWRWVRWGGKTRN